MMRANKKSQTILRDLAGKAADERPERHEREAGPHSALLPPQPRAPPRSAPVGLGAAAAVGNGDDRSVKIKSLEAAKIMKIKWLVLGCIEADFCK